MKFVQFDPDRFQQYSSYRKTDRRYPEINFPDDVRWEAEFTGMLHTSDFTDDAAGCSFRIILLN